MKTTIPLSVLAVQILLGPSVLAGAAIDFEDAYAALGYPNKSATFYQPTLGVTISGSYFGLIGGITNGDPGNFDLTGTNGPAGLACNSGNSCSPTFNFATPVTSASIDLGAPGSGAANVTLTVTALLDSTVVDTDVITLKSPLVRDEFGTWGNASVAGTFNSLQITSNFASGFFFGMDNLQFTPAAAAVPEPSTWLMAAGGLFGIALRRLRR